MKKRVCIFVDGANFFHGVRTFGKKYSDIHFDFSRYFKNLVGEDILVEIFYYNASLKEGLNKRIFWRQQRMFDGLRKIKNCNVVLCKRKPRIDNLGEKYHIIKGDDVCLALDMISCAYENKYDKVFLVSSDGDFAPLVDRVLSLKKEVCVCYFEECISNDLLNVCLIKKKIGKSVVKRYFLK